MLFSEVILQSLEQMYFCPRDKLRTEFPIGGGGGRGRPTRWPHPGYEYVLSESCTLCKPIKVYMVQARNQTWRAGGGTTKLGTLNISYCTEAWLWPQQGLSQGAGGWPPNDLPLGDGHDMMFQFAHFYVLR